MARINAEVLTEKLIANPDYILQILEALGFDYIRDKGKYFQFPNKDGDNMTSCVVWKETLVYNNYTRIGQNGNIYTLTMSEICADFPKTLAWIANEIGLSSGSLSRTIRRPFGGFYKSLMADTEDIEDSMKIYSESALKDDLGKFNMMWYNDGVDFQTQQVFNLGYNLETNSILIPIYNTAGELVGCKARRNDTKCEDSERWWAYLPFPKTQIVYGYHWNYKKIIEKDICIITESEKSVHQCYSFNCHLALSVLGHDISKAQAKHIKSLRTRKIIVAFDEGLEESIIREQAERLIVNNKIFQNKVGYIFDRNHKYLKEGSKDSPSDNNKQVFQSLLKECVVWIN